MSNAPKKDNAGVIMFPPLLYLLVLLAGLGISHFYPFQLLPKGIEMFVGIVLLVSFFVLLIPAARIFTRYNTTVNPSGRTTTIVDKGIYQYTRNPMYLAFTLFYCGVSILTNAWFSFLLLLPLLVLVQKGIINREEAYLESKFGHTYLSYKAKVRRWL